METWIRRACLQRAYRQFVTWLLVGIGLLVGIVSMHTYWANFFDGPYPVTATNAVVLTYGGEKEFVRVTGRETIDSGVREYTTETRNGVEQQRYASSTYNVLVVGDKGLVVKGDAPLTAIGQLAPLPGNIPSLIFPDGPDANLRDRLYPMMLDTTDSYRAGGYVMIAVTLLYAILFWVVGMRAYRQIQNITIHPVIQRVEGWTDAMEVALMSEKELASSPRYKASGIVLTDNFAIVRGFYTFNLLPWNHLLWAYRKVTTRTYFFIPISRTSQANLHFYGGSVAFPARKKIVEEVLTFAIRQAPWAIVGHTPELRNAWDKDNKGFGAAVESRRQQIEHQVLEKATIKPPPPPLSQQGQL